MLLAGVLTAPRSACADEPMRIVVVRTEGGSTTAIRLEAELRSLGLIVVTKPTKEEVSSRASLEQAARNENAIAAVQVIAHGTRAELWIVDRVTGKTVLREVATAGSSRGTTDDTIAVGVAELLRASLMETRAATSQKYGDYPAGPETSELLAPVLEATQEPRSTRAWLALGVLMELGPRGIGPSVGAHVMAGVRGADMLGLEVLAGTILAPAVIETSAGKASVTSQWFGSGGTIDWENRANWLSGRLGFGIVAAHTESRAQEVTPTFAGFTDATWSAGPYLHGGPAFGSGAFRLRLDTGVLFLLKAPTIHFAKDAVGTWGAPALFVSINVEGLVLD